MQRNSELQRAGHRYPVVDLHTSTFGIA